MRDHPAQREQPCSSPCSAEEEDEMARVDKDSQGYVLWTQIYENHIALAFCAQRPRSQRPSAIMPMSP